MNVNRLPVHLIIYNFALLLKAASQCAPQKQEL